MGVRNEEPHTKKTDNALQPPISNPIRVRGRGLRRNARSTLVCAAEVKFTSGALARVVVSSSSLLELPLATIPMKTFFYFISKIYKATPPPQSPSHQIRFSNAHPGCGKRNATRLTTDQGIANPASGEGQNRLGRASLVMMPFRPCIGQGSRGFGRARGGSGSGCPC